MAGQRIEHGIEWALPVFLPVGITYLLIVFIEAFHGPIVAGIATILLTILVCAAFVSSAKYWHIPSTNGFLIAGIFLMYILPDMLSDIVPWPFRFLQTLIFIGALVIVAYLLVNKVMNRIG